MFNSFNRRPSKAFNRKAWFGGNINAKIAALFANGEAGAWYDPGDLTSMRQLPTAVASVGQTVSLLMDKSAGMALGPNVVVNGTFDTDTVWTKQTAEITVAGGVGVFTACPDNRNLYQQNIITAGVTYQITFDIVSLSQGQFYCAIGGATSLSAPFTTTGTKTAILTATLSSHVNIVSSGTTTGTVDNVVVCAVSGNHATQATGSKRPILRQGTPGKYLEHDLVDDVLTVTFPNMGSACSVNYCTASGVTTLTGQTISGSYNLPADAADYGYIIIDRALTASEQAIVSRFLNTKAGL